ncbi:MAG: phosphotransferase [Gammaproteobacteria bacterium]|nr:phosphotransferase [Gammaproteobacteria bacterium]
MILAADSLTPWRRSAPSAWTCLELTLVSNEMLRQWSGYSLKGLLALTTHGFFSITDKLGNRFVLRVSKDLSQRQVKCEATVLEGLSCRGILVPTPVRNDFGNLLGEVRISGISYTGLLMTYLEGARFNHAVHWVPQVQRAIGSIIGQIQAELDKFRHLTPSNWLDRDLIINASNLLFFNDEPILNLLSELVQKATCIVDDQGVLIHGDAHPWNFRFRRDQLGVFDFDNCYIFVGLHDLAVPLQISLDTSFLNGNPKELILSWLDGYSTWRPVPDFYREILEILVGLLRIFRYLSLCRRKRIGFKIKGLSVARNIALKGASLRT